MNPEIPAMRPYIWMLSGCFWFSWMAILTSNLRHDCDWQVIAIFRSGLAMIFALGLAFAVGAPLVFLRPGMLWIRSIAGSCSMVSTFYALTHMPVSDVLTITNTFPIWVAMLSWPMAGEKPTTGVWLAALSAVIGVAMTQQSDLILGRVSDTDMATVTHRTPIAPWSALAASVFTAVAMLGLNRLRGVSSLGVVVHFSGVATVFCIGAYFAFETHTGNANLLSSSVLWMLLGVGATATIGQVFLTLAFREGSPSKVAVVGLSQVVMVMVMEATGGRTFEWPQIVGTVFVLGPTGWLMLRERKPVPIPEPTSDEIAAEDIPSGVCPAPVDSGSRRI